MTDQDLDDLKSRIWIHPKNQPVTQHYEDVAKI